MAQPSFCTRCGAGLPAGAAFCTACGAPVGAPSPASGAPPQAASPRPVSPPVHGSRAKAPTPAAIAVGVVLLAAGSGAAWLALGSAPVAVQRAVPGAPSGGAPRGQAQQQQGAMPDNHPSIDLPDEVKAFLQGLADEAAKNPTSVEHWQKLARARYRASILNPTWQAPAATAVAKLMEIDPGNQEGLRLSANLAYDAGDFPEAQKRFEKFLETSPDDASAITDLGSTLLFQDQPEAALAKYDLAASKDPKFMQAWFNKGIAYEKLGKKDESLASLKKAFELAEQPEQKQHVENAIAHLEQREPRQVEGAAPRQAPVAAGSAAAPGANAPSGGAQAPSGGAMAQAPGAATPPSGAPPASGGGMPMPPPAPEREVPTNASSDFQRAVQKDLIVHPIVGPRVASFQWTGPAAGSVRIANFPMDQMPPFARIKFKSGMNDKLAAAAKAAGLDATPRLELVDDATGRVMDVLDGTAPSAPAGAPGSAPGGMP